jgi:hypothetical protein
VNFVAFQPYFQIKDNRKSPIYIYECDHFELGGCNYDVGLSNLISISSVALYFFGHFIFTCSWDYVATNDN